MPRGKAPTVEQLRELQALIVEGDQLLRLLGQDPDAPVDLAAIIANGQAALTIVLAPERHAEYLRLIQQVTNPCQTLCMGASCDE